MGKKGKWFDTVQRILSTSEPDPVETEARDDPTHSKKAVKPKDRSSFKKKIWHFSKSGPSHASSTSAATDAHEPLPSPVPPASQPEEHQQDEEIAAQERFQTAETRSEEGDGVLTAEEGDGVLTAEDVSSMASMADAEAAPGALPARSLEDVAATRIQAVCRGYQARRAHQERGMARLMSLVEGPAVQRQTEEALYCMQAMTRVQTQICTRRLKTEEDKKALKSQIKAKQTADRTKIGKGWDTSCQSKEQMEAVQTMKQEAASRRQKAMEYAFSHQWRNRNPSSARAVPSPPPMFMDPGSPSWGWSCTERWMAAATPWESQSQTAEPDNDGRGKPKSAGRQPRVAISIQLPTTPSGKSSRPPNWPPSLPSPSTPPPRSPSLSWRTTSVPASPRSNPLHALQRTKSMQPDRRPRSSQERPAGSPRHAVPASPKGAGGGKSPLHAVSGLQPATTSVQAERRPRSSQEHAVSSPRHDGKDASLRRTTSLRAEVPKRLSLEGTAAAGSAPAGDEASSPVTPSYMQPTKSVKAKAVQCVSPSASTSAEKPDVAPLRVASPSSAKKRLSVAVPDKPGASSLSTPKAEKAKRPPSPRTQLA